MRMRLLAALWWIVAASDPAYGEVFDRVEEALTFSNASGQARMRLSGTLDLEGYQTQLPAPGVIDTTNERFLNPRLSVFLDGQWGRRLYFFAQARADRGFDPGDRPAEVRLDEVALRITPRRQPPKISQSKKSAAAKSIAFCQNGEAGSEVTGFNEVGNPVRVDARRDRQEQAPSWPRPSPRPEARRRDHAARARRETIPVPRPSRWIGTWIWWRWV